MDLQIENKSGPVLSRGVKKPSLGAFTLVEVLIVMLLLTMLVVAAGSGIMAMDRSSRRLADYTAAMSVIEAKIHSIRAATYNPPSYPFGTNILYLTNTSSVALSQAGTNFLVTGTVISKIQPVASGHLVTVTGTFSEPSQSFSVTLQSLVNRYSGGEE
jgi:type II secretory pathway pseudopilin PulG